MLTQGQGSLAANSVIPRSIGLDRFAVEVKLGVYGSVLMAS